MTNWNIESLRPYVTGKKDKDTAELERAGLQWLAASAKNKISYEVEWLGIPVIQTPEDLVLMQELIFREKPDFIIETGVAHGGSLIFYSSLFELLGHGKVIGIDIEIRAHNRRVLETHPMYKRITLLEGSSTSEQIISQVAQLVPAGSKSIVCLDSNHTKEHVLRELELYERFVPKDSYLVVFDTCTDALARVGALDASFIGNDPAAAVKEFVSSRGDFEVDPHFDRLYISASPGGYLKRVK